jgi:hypothetical protein
MGEMDAARLAGIRAAMKEQMARATVATESATGFRWNTVLARCD